LLVTESLTLDLALLDAVADSTEAAAEAGPTGAELARCSC